MQLRRDETLTGLLVLVTVAILVFILVLLGTPGLFRPLITYRVYFYNASGIKPGAPVLLAGRNIGQVKSLYSPVSREEAAHAMEAAGNLGTIPFPADASAHSLPRLEVRIDVEVDRMALVYKNSSARLTTLGLLGETAIDISGGTDHSSRAEPGQVFIGNRVPDFSEAIGKLLGIVQPVATEATATLKELQRTAANLNKITNENSELNQAFGQFKVFATHLTDLTAPEGALSQSLKNIRDLSEQLTKNDNIKVTLQNFRNSSEELDSLLTHLGPDLKATAHNAADFTDTLRSQPWRLIWPTTKKYPVPEASPSATPRPARTKSRQTTSRSNQ